MFRSLFRKDPAQEAGEALFLTVSEQARLPVFYADFGAPDTVEGRFEMLALHAWLVMRRLKGGPDPAGKVSQKLFDVMFSDLDAALRELGVGDLVVGKRIRKLAENFYGRLGAYEKAIIGDGEELEATLARNIFQSDGGQDCAGLAGYVRAAVACLEEQPQSRIVGGVVRFPAPEEK